MVFGNNKVHPAADVPAAAEDPTQTRLNLLSTLTRVTNLSCGDTGGSLYFEHDVVPGAPGPSRVVERPSCPFEAKYALHFVPGSVVLALEAIPTHEELLASGRIVKIPGAKEFSFGKGFHDGYGACYEMISTQLLQLEDGTFLSMSHKRVFFSHRWVQHPDGTATPDDKEGRKLAKMKALVQPGDLVWFDYMCIPQLTRDTQLAAVASLPYYIGHSDVVHILATDDENYAQYKTRAFTNIELVCASLPVTYGGYETADGAMSGGNAHVKVKPLCAIYDTNGAAYPFLNPVKADMYDKNDLRYIENLIDFVRAKCRDALASMEEKGMERPKDKDDVTRLLAFLDA
eukprot:Opistho-2@38465